MYNAKPIYYKREQIFSFHIKKLEKEEKTTSEIHPRYASKERISKERDYMGSYKIPSDTLKKRTNPTQDYIKKKEEELLKAKMLLEEYERRLDEAAAKTKLPDNPDMEKVEKFVERINRIAVNEDF